MRVGGASLMCVSHTPSHSEMTCYIDCDRIADDFHRVHCSNCELQYYESDINNWDCPAGDASSSKCPYSRLYDEIMLTASRYEGELASLVYSWR